MAWRKRTRDAEKNQANMSGIVATGGKPGLLAYEAGRPVGWVSIAPRETYGQLMRSRTYGPFSEEAGVWSIVCFYVDPPSKRQGVATALMEAAVAHAFERGAEAVEVYPREGGDYMGSREGYERLGFQPVREAGARTVMRLTDPTRATAAPRSMR